MNGTFRTLAIGFGVAICAGSITACDDKPVMTADVLAEDSTLNLQVMSARGDTLVAPLDSDLATAALDAPAEPAASLSAPASEPEFATVQRKPSRAIARRTPRGRATTTVLASNRKVNQPAQRRRSTTIAATPARWTRATVASGTTMKLVAGQKICSYASRVGDAFNNLLNEPVAATNGVTIPKGALVVARITSIGKDGSEIGVRAESVRFHGRTFPMRSDATFAVRGDDCLAERGEITARLIAPLPVADRVAALY